MNPGDAGLDTWASLDAARHGGAQPWLPGVYDPETASISSAPATPRPPTPAWRATGDNLFTCALVAVHVDTGKMAWYFQTSPHDMHDWDSAQTPVLFDAAINGQAPQACVDRRAQRVLLHGGSRHGRARGDQPRYGSATNWVQSVAAERIAAARSG